MKYKEFNVRTNLCTKVGHKRYQFTVNGVVVYETDDASMYDALSGNEEDWDMEEYQNANGAAEYVLGWLQDMYGGLPLDILRRLMDCPHFLPTCSDYAYLIDSYARFERRGLSQAREVAGSWTGEQWLEYFKGK